MFRFFSLSNDLHPGWPEKTPRVALRDGSRVRLRPLSGGDGRAWGQSRLLDESWLKPVEPTVTGSWESAHSPAAWRTTWANLRRLASEGVVVPFAITVDGAFAGQVTLGNIQHGAVSECWIGYWVASFYMGRGVATAACALGVDHAFHRVGLHRVTATYMPGNGASARVLARNGFREEGYLRRNLHIDGAWRDHHLVALNRDDFAETAVHRLIDAGRVTPA